MARVKRGVTSKAKHKKVLKAVKGQYGRRKNTIRVARQAMEKAMQYAYRDRRNKKRDFKSLWIQRINAGVRSEGLTYSKFIKPFLPNISVLIISTSWEFWALKSLSFNSSFNFSKSDISTDYFLTEEKQ